MTGKLYVLIQILQKFFDEGQVHNKSALVQLMAWCLLCTKPLPEPMLPYCQLDPKECISVEFYF